MSKQTAVEWLYERLERMIPRTALYNIDKKQYFKQAKAMEKEQMNDMFCEGSKLIECPNELSARFEFAMYYNETYGGDK